MRRTVMSILLALALIFGGAVIAARVQTDGGTAVREVSVPIEKGGRLTALLYVPRTATAAAKAPAVMLSHGFINTREMQSPFAIELARRGFVVLAIDMTGHGHSDAIVGAAGFGGPDALRFLRSLPYVDRDRIGLEGHSMGGGPVMAASLAFPDGYRSAVLVGSTPRFGGEFVKPRNLAIVFGTYEELAELMWKVPRGDEVMRSRVRTH